MKKSFKICAFLLLCASLTFAQGFNFGVRTAVGASNLRSHIPVPVHVRASSVLDVEYFVRMEPALSAGIGLAFVYNFNDLIGVAPELQYTLYRANGEFMRTDGKGKPLARLNEAGVELHALEMPILARFSFGEAFGLGSWYAEVGPQVGFNLDAKAYGNEETYKPADMNLFAFGPSLGAGINLKGLLLGFRGYLGILEYAENTKGYPWTVQVSLTKLFF